MKKRIEYVGFFTRFLAYLVDQFVVASILVFLTVILGLAGLPVYEIILPFTLVIMWLYYTFQESSKHMATLGKRALRINVTDLRGKRISFLKATGRFVTKIVTGWIFGIGYLVIPFTKKHQGLYDMIVGTYVVKVGKPRRRRR